MSTFALNSGTYFGNGYSGGYTSYNNNVASSTKINRMSRDIASGYTADMEAIQNYLLNGKTDKAIDMYNELLEEMSLTADEYGYELSDGQKASILSNAYQQATGERFGTAIQENTHSAFVTGLLEGIPIVGLFMNSTSSEEAMALASGTQPELKDQVAEVAGSLVSGFACGAAIGAIAGPLGSVVGGTVGTVIKAISKAPKLLKAVKYATAAVGAGRTLLGNN